jgi:hypothetical protein
MALIRWFAGFFRAIVGLWSQPEWFYYAKTGLDPKLPAFQRWAVKVKHEDRKAGHGEDDRLAQRNYSVILHDNFMLTPEEVLFFTQDKDKVDALEQQYQRELGSRTSGEFYYTMVKGRKLDFFHDYKVIQPAPLETEEIDEEQKREMFIR